MNFSPTTRFKFWLGDRLVAKYMTGPGMGYTARSADDVLRALVTGTVLPGSESATVEMPDLSQVEVKPGEVCPGWAKQGLVVITGLGDTGGLSGTAEVKKREG
jgi:hypothetical protein